MNFLSLYDILIGDAEAALDALEHAYQSRSPMLSQLLAAPWLDPLQRDPRFVALLQRMVFR